MLSEAAGDEDTRSSSRNVDNIGGGAAAAAAAAAAAVAAAAAARPATVPQSYDVARPRRTSVEERLAGKMFVAHSREILCLFVGVALSLGFAALHSVPPRVSKPPSARPFFDRSSVVVDFYKGHLDAMVERASDADLTFVMYYAPWDAESQAARQEFESVARYYYSRIFFAAINCWHPGSECRTRYSKIQSYPVLMLYSSRDSGIQYRGIMSAPYIMRFLDSFVRPIERITSKEQLARLVVENDAVVVGFVSFQGLSTSPGYKEFYTAATRFLERDPNRDVAFALVTDAGTASDEFGIDTFPSASLAMWNETLIYPREKIFTCENLLKWIGESMHKVALWLQPPGVKSLTIAPYLRDGPVLFLFTPRNPLHRSNYNFNLLKQVALQYYSCDGILPMKNLVDNLRRSSRDAATLHRERTKRCSLLVNKTGTRDVAPAVSVSVQQWINESCCAKIVMNKCLLCKKTMGSFRLTGESGVCSLTDNNFQEICKGTDIFRAPESTGDDYEKQQQQQQRYCCPSDLRWSSEPAFHGGSSSSSKKKYKSSMLTGENDGRSAKAVRAAFLRDECTKFLVGNKYHYPHFPEDTGTEVHLKSTASACRVNKTLAFIAIDSLQYFHFADNLGIDVAKIKDKTAVVILDSDQESQYVMKRIANRNSLAEFVNAYAQGLLQRTLRSNSSKGSIGCEPAANDAEICVPELTTDTFFKVVMEPTMNVVVMYHTPYCAFCSSVSYVYLTVAKYLGKMDHLSFVRIDGDNNDLPWEYSMDRYPSIIFFPAKRKEDSTVYPFSLPVTVRNLLNFVLANLEDDSHIEALVNVCRLGSGEAPKDCVVRTRRLCLDIIEKLLRSYRRLRRKRGAYHGRTASNAERREILLKLEHIRDIHLILGSVEDLGKDDSKYQLIDQKFKTYYRNLEALGKPNGRAAEGRTKRENHSESTSARDKPVVDRFS